MVKTSLNIPLLICCSGEQTDGRTDGQNALTV